MGTIVGFMGNQAVAEAMRQIHPDVCAAYPITPSTQVMEIYSQFVADGKVSTELVAVESEHSAISACVGAAAAGARVMTATSAQGLALMHEILYIAASMRLPIILANVNRALSAPINIHVDHSDSMGSRDAGWIQLYSENAQEAYDNLIQAVRISEHPDVLTPVMVCLDGFTISHSIERMEILSDREVQAFVGTYKPRSPLLDIDRPVTYGALDLQDYYIEHKRQQREALDRHALRVICEVGTEFGALSGRHYDVFEAYRLDDAELGVVVMSSAAGAVKESVDALRSSGVRAGALRLRAFRPFPAREVARVLGHLRAVAVLDRAEAFGTPGGPLFADVRMALFDVPNRPQVVSFIFGLGGRDFMPEDAERVYDRLRTVAATGQTEPMCEYLSVRA
ncbi:MAG: pyruvate ferredoxin oxidoreductase [Candidatus Methylomirabilales bacterium]